LIEKPMRLKVLQDAEAVAREAATHIAGLAEKAVRHRGRFILAVSGGRTPWLMLRLLAGCELPWESVHVVQVDERLAPRGHPHRNLTHLQESLLAQTRLPDHQIYAMPVESEDLPLAAVNYAHTLRHLAGTPPVLDLIHLGLGADGHTASLVPGDPVIDIHQADVALTGVYQGRRRMTLTYPIINRSRNLLWLVTGSDRSEMLRRLFQGDRTIPAGRVRRDQAVIFADADAAAQVESLPDGNLG